MTRSSLRFLIILCISLVPALLLGQTNAKLGYRFGDNWLIGASVGPVFFSGDLKSDKLFPAGSDLRIAGSIFVGRQMSPVFTIRGQFFFGSTAGTKENVHFDATLLEGNINTMINFSNLIGGNKPERLFFIYGTVGLGVTGFTTKKIDLVTNTEIYNDGSNWRTAAVFPLGLGSYFSINNKINIGLEYTYRLTTSDLIDGTTGGFKLDGYSYLSLGITFNFNKGTRKPAKVVDLHDEGPIIINLPNCDPLPPPTTENQLMNMAKLPTAPLMDKDYTYKVQIFAFNQHIYSAETIQKRYHVNMQVTREYSDGLYRFTVGTTESLQEARDIRNKMIQEGILDAFIVSFNIQGDRMPFQQSLQN